VAWGAERSLEVLTGSALTLEKRPVATPADDKCCKPQHYRQPRRSVSDHRYNCLMEGGSEPF
jgi:hypothetical protein